MRLSLLCRGARVSWPVWLYRAEVWSTAVLAIASVSFAGARRRGINTALRSPSPAAQRRKRTRAGSALGNSIGSLNTAPAWAIRQNLFGGSSPLQQFRQSLHRPRGDLSARGDRRPGRHSAHLAHISRSRTKLAWKRRQRQPLRTGPPDVLGRGKRAGRRIARGRLLRGGLRKEGGR